MIYIILSCAIIATFVFAIVAVDDFDDQNYWEAFAMGIASAGMFVVSVAFSSKFFQG